MSSLESKYTTFALPEKAEVCIATCDTNVTYESERGQPG